MNAGGEPGQLSNLSRGGRVAQAVRATRVGCGGAARRGGRAGVGGRGWVGTAWAARRYRQAARSEEHTSELQSR